MKIIEEAIQRGEKTLSEHDSKKVLEAYSIPVTKEFIAKSLDEAKAFAREIGYPVVLKGHSSTLTHKTELNMIELDLKDEKALTEAYNGLQERGKGQLEGVLVQPMIKGDREFVAGLIRDPQFGPCVMFGLGGIFTEVLKDVTFRVAPLEKRDALEMMDEIKAKKLLDNFRGKPAVNREALANTLINLGRIGLENPEIAEIDINPLKVSNDMPIAVDALVVLKDRKK
ncbi:MAG TPA: acetate--CoA ligase family protein [Deltaproteobacteria bacterium]|jgi:acetyl-CoA synthetase (ADP-forming)|nr:acetate--CoA ligase family protein [Deltaproteobacteria bacterium]HOI06769.1 acetate--CoA ligase family protein [Deltaproteobacteria bacterium]